MSFWRKVILCLALLPQSDGSVNVDIPIHNAEASFWSTNLGLLKKVEIWCQGSSNQKRLLEKFHGEIEDWDTSKVTLMTFLFPSAGCDDQNPDVSKWDVSNVRSMLGIFQNMENFNQDLSQWTFLVKYTCEICCCKILRGFSYLFSFALQLGTSARWKI